MSVIGNPLLLGGDAGAPSFTTERSVRLRSSASGYFNRTFGTSTSTTKSTLSMWVKLGNLSSSMWLFEAGIDVNNRTSFYLSSSGQLSLQYISGGTTIWNIATSAVYRDPSAWYHIVVTKDPAQSIAADRYKLFVNGVLQTMSGTFPALNQNDYWNASSVFHQIGRYFGATNYFDGYLTEVNFVDGQALTPASFGEYDSVRNTQWKPKAYTGTYGTNGFYLKFSNPASIGADSSGNSNTWTANNIQTSNSALTTYDSMLDVPTLTSATNANFAVMNPLDNQATLSNGNLTQTTGAAERGSRSTFAIPDSGLFYAEATVTTTTTAATTSATFGLCTSSVSLTASGFNTAGIWGLYSSNFGYINRNGTPTASLGFTLTAGDVVQIAVDPANSRAWIGRNNTWYDSGTGTTGNPSGGTNPTVSSLPSGLFVFVNGFVETWNINFGQRPFAQTPPTGFKRLNTYNLPDPAVASSDDYHKIYTYTGNGGGLQVGEVQKPASLFNLDRSLRLRASNSAYLSRTLTTPTNNKIWTWSAWVKRGKASGTSAAALHLFGTGSGSTDAGTTQIYFDNENLVLGGYNTPWLKSNAVYRDPLLWYHIVVAWDNSNGTATNRAKIYVNGVEITYVTDNRASLSTTSTYGINQAVLHTIGAWSWNNGTFAQPEYYDGYLSDVYFIDGQALTPTDFGAYDGNYYWTPKAYTGTYGTNGFHLEFEDFSAATAAAIGKDTSGNVNNWTPSGISVTAGATYDSMTDVPTLTSATTANYCVINPLVWFGSVAGTVSDGNLAVSSMNTTARLGSIGVQSGAWYFEVVGSTATDRILGVSDDRGNQISGYRSDGTRYNGTTYVAYGATYTTNDVIGVAFNVTSGTMEFFKNGISQGQVTSVSYTGLIVTPYLYGGGTNGALVANFGQRPFTYTPPTGFKAINSFNIAEVTGDLESPDFVWIKSRSASGDHALFNSVTGVGKYLRTSNAVLEVTDVNSLIQFNKNGFLLGNAAIANASATTFVASAWKVAATTVTNTNGSVTSQVRSNPTSGISIATFTAAASGNFTVGHGLGVAPAMVILKNRAATDSFYVYNRNFATPTTHYLQMNSTSVILSSASVWGSTNPTSSVVTLGAGGGIAANASGIIYSFSDVAGFSKFGSYLSNNAADGPFVYTGFRPRWLMVKRAMTTAGAAGWFMYDAERNTYNVMDKYLFAEGTAGDNTLAVFDFTSNGFKIRSNNVHVNTTAGDTYIYMAFAEHPFKYALAR